MIYIIASMAVFGGAVGIQLLLHRWLERRGIVTFHTFWVFVIGGMVEAIVLWQLSAIAPRSESVWWSPFLVSGMVLYATCCIDWAVLSASPLLGDESPSSVVLRLLSDGRSRTAADIATHFSDDELVGKRLIDMKKTGWVEQKGDHYVAVGKGKFIAGFLSWYRQVLAADTVG